MSAIHVIHWAATRHFGWSVPEGSGEASVVRHIVAGNVDGTITRIDCYDVSEDWARDVTEDIARACASYYGANTDEGMLPQVRDFIETHGGLALTRGLRVDDRTFAAA